MSFNRFFFYKFYFEAEKLFAQKKWIVSLINNRVDEYDSHMLNDVIGCKEGYDKIANLVPRNAVKLLDLGCGTGLELQKILKLNPNIEITGIDLSQGMLNKLKQKYSKYNIKLICDNYLECEFGKDIFDCVISFQTMHHFNHENKLKIYKKIHDALKSNGVYIEGDYVAKSQEEENFYFSEFEKIRKEQNINKNQLVHLDTPCTVENQIKLLKTAGFSKSEKVWQVESTAIIVNWKK